MSQAQAYTYYLTNERLPVTACTRSAVRHNDYYNDRFPAAAGSADGIATAGANETDNVAAY